MANLEAEKAALIAEITAAFDGASREDGITLHEAQAKMDASGPEKRAAARALDTEARWQDVPTEDFYCSDLILLAGDPKGFRYYLPAFLISCLKTDEGYDDFDSLCLALDSVSKIDLMYHIVSIPTTVSLLTLEQSKAIAHFCAFSAEQSKKTEQSEKSDMELQERNRVHFQEEGWTEDEITSHLEQYQWLNHGQSALDRYWGQFL